MIGGVHDKEIVVMTTLTLTLELPDALARLLREREIGEQEIKSITLAALEVWLAQEGQGTAARQGRFSENAVQFARQLVAQNRELFLTLANR